MAKTSIGVDIGSSSVRAAEIGTRAGQTRLIRFGQVALPDGAVRDGEVVDSEAVADALRELWGQAKFSRRVVTLGVANPRVAIRKSEVPYFGSMKEMRQALPLIVGDQVPMDVSDSVMDFAPLEEIRNSDGTRALSGLLVAAVESVVAASVDSVRAAGLTPETVDLSSFAVLRACVPARGLGLGARAEAIIDIGADLTSIIVHENGMPRFVRILAQGGATITRELVEKLGLTLAEAEATKRECSLVGAGSGTPAERIVRDVASTMADEIRGTVDYYAATAAQGAVNSVSLSGGGSRLTGLDHLLADRLHVPVGAARSLDAVDASGSGLSFEQLEYVQALATVPVGLALGAVA